MAPRATFKGFLRLSLVSVPGKGFTASQSDREIRMNQLHAECNSRIKYQKVCPTHGEVKNDEIVHGYEHEKDQYVIVDPEEVAKIRKESDKAVEVRGFVPENAIEPMYFSGRTYFILPDGPAGQKPYQLLRDGMEQNGLFAIATAILSGREQVVAIRPIDGVLGMTVLVYKEKLRNAADFTDEVKEAKLTKEEKALTQTLIDASLLKEFDLGDFHDGYVDQLNEIIQAKIAGQEIVAAPEPEEPKIINLMDALKASVENARAAGPKSDKAEKKVTAKMAPSAKGKATRKKKSG
jgi:DNA end-binding protein Ku